MAGLDRFTNTHRHSLILIKGLSVIYEHCLTKRGNVWSCWELGVYLIWGQQGLGEGCTPIDRQTWTSYLDPPAKQTFTFRTEGRGVSDRTAEGEGDRSPRSNYKGEAHLQRHETTCRAGLHLISSICWGTLSWFLTVLNTAERHRLNAHAGRNRIRLKSGEKNKGKGLKRHGKTMKRCEIKKAEERWMWIWKKKKKKNCTSLVSTEVAYITGRQGGGEGWGRAGCAK